MAQRTLTENINQAIADFEAIKTAIADKGVPVPDGTPTSAYGDMISEISGEGVDTSNDTVTPDAMREGYTAHDAAGQEITGTIPDYSGGNTVEMTSPDGATLNTAGTYCEGNIEVVPKLQEKVATTGEIVTSDEGYSGLKSVDTTPVFEAGKKSECDAFWDVYQGYGLRDYYEAAFVGNVKYLDAGWTKENFKPKYDIILRGGYSGRMMFWCNCISDVPAILERQGVVLDTTRCNVFEQAFQNSLSERWGVISMVNATNSRYAFDQARCKTIEKLIVSENTQLVNTFIAASYLSNLTIEGKIGQNGFNVSWSPLSKASLTSIVNALSSTTTGLTVTFRLAAVNTAFETAAGAADGSTSEEWTALIATKPNWTINLINS